MSYTQNFDLDEDWRLAIRSLTEEMEEILREISQKGQEKVLATDSVAWRNVVDAIGWDPPLVSDDEIRGVAGVASSSRTAHAWALESGLKPGKWRPLDDLQAWAERKFGVEEEEARSIAVGTQRKLHAQGTRGVYYMRDALALVRGDIEKRLVEAMDLG